MKTKKKRSPIFIISVLLLLCVTAGILFLAVNIFAHVEIKSVETSPEAAESCRAKITKMLIDETLAFNYQKTTDVPFSELEINSWLKEEPGHNRIIVQLIKDRVTFSGFLNPLVKKTSEGKSDHSLFKFLEAVSIAFKIVSQPTIRSNRIVFEPETIVLGRLHIPPNLMPELPNTLNLNPFEKKIRTIKAIRIADGSLLVTVYAD